MRRAIVLAVLMVRGAAALPSLAGTVNGPAGPIDGAKITLWMAGNKHGVQTLSSAGRFSIGDLRAGDYIFRVDSKDMMCVLGAVRLAGDAPHEIGVVMLDALRGDRDAAGAGSALRDAIRPSYDAAAQPAVELPQILRKVIPSYPRSATKARMGGAVRIAAIVLPDGTLDDLVVLSSPGADLAKAALMATLQWQYSPARLNGQAVETNFTINVGFQLR